MRWAGSANVLTAMAALGKRFVNSAVIQATELAIELQKGMNLHRKHTLQAQGLDGPASIVSGE